MRASRIYVSQTGYVYNTKSFYPAYSNAGGEGRGSTFSSAIARVDKGGDETASQGQLSATSRRRSVFHRLLTAGKHAEVQRLVTEEINTDNEDAVTLYMRAKLAEKEKNYEEAIEYYGKVL